MVPIGVRPIGNPCLFTSLLWSGHCIQLAITSTAMIQIYIFGTRINAVSNNKSYFNVIFCIMPQAGLQKACWSHQVVRNNNFLLGLTWVERTSDWLIFFFKRDFIRVPGWITRYSLRVPSHLTMYSWQYVHLCYDNTLTPVAPMSCISLQLVANYSYRHHGVNEKHYGCRLIDEIFHMLDKNSINVRDHCRVHLSASINPRCKHFVMCTCFVAVSAVFGYKVTGSHHNVTDITAMPYECEHI